MDIATKVEKFKKDLKNTKVERFNIWAFIFGSFYFLCTGISVWYFFLFYVFPWIFTAALAPLNPHIELWLILGFAISHICAGFVANPEGRKYKEDYIKRVKGLKLNADVKYFNISLLRLWLSSFFTLGLYDIYWSYRNWSAYKKATKDDIEPLLAALFNFLTIFSLQSKIHRLLPERKKIDAICAALYSIVFISVAFAVYYESLALAGILTLIAYIILPLLLLPIQKSINKLAGKTTKEYSKWEVVLLVLGVLTFMHGFLTPDPLEVRLEGLTEVQQQNIGETVGFLYRHKQGYAKICAAEGYQLRQYPNGFSEYFKDGIDNFEKFLRSRGITLSEMTDEVMPESLKTKILMTIYDELRMLRRSVTVNLIAGTENTSPDNVVWKEEWENVIPLAEVCQLFDVGGVELLKNSSIKDFFKDKKF